MLSLGPLVETASAYQWGLRGVLLLTLTPADCTLVTHHSAQVDLAVVMVGEGAALSLTQGRQSALAQQAKRSQAPQAGQAPSTRCLAPMRWSEFWPPISVASRRL